MEILLELLAALRTARALISVPLSVSSDDVNVFESVRMKQACNQRRKMRMMASDLLGRGGWGGGA